MTREQLDAIRARVEAATPGPWHVEGESYDECWDKDCEPLPMPWGLAGPTGKSLWSSGAGEYAHPDMATAEFIASAREDVPALLAEVERLTAEREWARDVLEKQQARITELGATNDALVNRGLRELLTLRDKAREDSFKRGVAAMREAAIKHFGQYGMEARHLRALPDPEDKR